MPASPQNPYERLSDVELEALVVKAAPFRVEGPSDDELVETMVRHGCPRKPARMQVANRGPRLFALRFWHDVRKANAGDAEARERVDVCREAWGRLKAAGATEG